MYDTKVVIHNGVCTLAVPFLYTPFQNKYGTATERPQHIIHYVSGASQCDNKFYHIAPPLRRQNLSLVDFAFMSLNINELCRSILNKTLSEVKRCRI